MGDIYIRRYGYARPVELLKRYKFAAHYLWCGLGLSPEFKLERIGRNAERKNIEAWLEDVRRDIRIPNLLSKLHALHQKTGNDTYNIYHCRAVHEDEQPSVWHDFDAARAEFELAEMEPPCWVY